ncbi:zinc finger and SCAN domain-containing protein 5B [Arvicola amphibius]|uniref:zinc finger and SCAN domain-containing protein 5B n=1 Tax=Arvicola amphibius TaxID=1047088 RepID=UPI001C0A1018|nr:zinc finger and SCAN domain-containing protein 5B [Arvicola amphibius]
MAASVLPDSLRSEQTPSLVSQETNAERQDYNPEVWHLKFRKFSPSEGSDPIQDLKQISELCCMWLRPDLHSKEEILDQLVLEQFIISAPLELQTLVKESKVKSCKELEKLLRSGEKPRQWSIIYSGEQVYLLRHPCAENAADMENEWTDVRRSPEHLTEREEPPNRGQAHPELQNLPETSQFVIAQGQTSFLRGSYLEMAKVKADDWSDNVVVLSDDSLSGDQASPGSQNLPRTESCISQEEEVFLVPGNREPDYSRPERNQGSDLVQDWDVLFLPQDPQPTQGHESLQVKAASVMLQEDTNMDVATPVTCILAKRDTAVNTDLQRLSSSGTDSLPTPQGKASVTGRARFGCSQCNKSFLYRSQLIIHQRTHTGERPFRCHLCKKGFLQSSDLRVHQRIHTGEKPYGCSTCSKVFAHESSLLDHIRIHTKEMPYQCESCGKRFNHKSNLNVHIGIHSDARPYKCMECNAAFRQKGALMRHVKIHSR